MQRLYGVTPQRVAKSQAALLTALALIESRIAGDPSRYPVGDQLSLADISAAALYAALFTPAGTSWAGVTGHDGKTQAFLDELHAHPAGQWVLRRYAQDRQHR